MEIRLLGPVQGWRKGYPVGLGPRQRRHVFAVLALEANRVVSVERLVALIWPTTPPRTAWQAIRGHVCRLRRVLGPDPRLVTEACGYMLLVDPQAVDVHQFRALVRQARVCLDDEETARLYRHALSLWRGPVLADLPGGDQLTRGLREQWLSAVEECLDAELRLGRHLAVLDELTELVSRHPRQQRFVSQLMLAHYRCARPADALDAYRAAKARLAADHGLDPQPELRALELAILHHDPALDLPARVSYSGRAGRWFA